MLFELQQLHFFSHELSSISNGTLGFAAAAIHAVKCRRYFTLNERFLKATNLDKYRLKVGFASC